MKPGPDGRFKFNVGAGHVGTNLLDIVSGALYGNVLDILREYIQNAVDAEAKRVRIVLRDGEVWIRDDGTGLTPERLDGARKVAVSAKREDQVGFRGIGLYSSYATCDSLELITRPKGQRDVFVLRLNFKGMRAEIERRDELDPPQPLPLLDALDLFTEIAVYTDAPPMGSGGAFALVRLINPAAHFVDALESFETLQAYLRRAVSLKFPAKHPHAAAIERKLRKHGVERRSIAVDLTPRGKDPGVRGHSIHFYADDGSNLLPPVVREITRGGKTLAVLWYAAHEKASVLPRDRTGIQLRLKGFGIGGVHVAEAAWATRAGSGVLYRHFLGEIHLVDTRLRPSAERSNLEDSPARRELMAALQRQFEPIGRWLEARRELMREIKTGKEKSRTDSTAKLEQLRVRYGSVPKPKLSVLIDPRVREVWEGRKNPTKRDAPSQETSDDDTPESGDETGGRDDKNPGSGRKSGPVPTLSKMLYDLGVPWPPAAKPVFDALDDAFREDLMTDVSVALRRAVQARLQKLALRRKK